MDARTKLHLIGITKAFAGHLSTFESHVKQRYPDAQALASSYRKTPDLVKKDIELLHKGRAQLRSYHEQLGIHVSTTGSPATGTAKA